MSESAIDALRRKARNFTWAKLRSKVRRSLLDAKDALRDYRICGRSLVKYVPSVYRDDEAGVGGTGTQATRYAILERIFSHVELTSNDSFFDVGCGKGRVLAYLVDTGAPCRLAGIELNPKSAEVALAWTKRHPNIHVTQGDAFKLDYDEHTVLFLNRPFLPKTFLAFVEKLEDDLAHPVTLIYLWDSESGYLLKGRPGWTYVYPERLEPVEGTPRYRNPERFSIWRYDPAARSGSNA